MLLAGGGGGGGGQVSSNLPTVPFIECEKDGNITCSIDLSENPYAITPNDAINGTTEAVYEFLISGAGILSLWTEGELDTNGTLANSSEDEVKLIEHRADRSGGDGNFFLRSNLSIAGRYYVRVRSASNGSYQVGFSFITSSAADEDKDGDGDGIPNRYDNCPRHFNNAQSDRDADGGGSGPLRRAGMSAMRMLMGMAYGIDSITAHRLRWRILVH